MHPVTALFYFLLSHITLRTSCAPRCHCISSWLVESMGFTDTFRITVVAGSIRGNHRIQTFYNQRDLKNQPSHICHFTVEQTTGDLERSRVTKLMISNAKTRMQIFCFLNEYIFFKPSLTTCKEGCTLVSIYFGFKRVKNHSSSPSKFNIELFFQIKYLVYIFIH